MSPSSSTVQDAKPFTRTAFPVPPGPVFVPVKAQ